MDSERDIERDIEGDFSFLDSAQKDAVFSRHPYLLIVAGPGSGKTRVLASRYACLVKEGVRDEKILAITFTNRAAIEMKTRIKGMGINPARPNIGTFHSFCLGILKKEKRFILSGRKGQEGILKGLGVKNIGKAIELISAFKNSCFSGSSDHETIPEGLDREVFNLYRQAMDRTGALDLDDLIIEAVRMFGRESRKIPVFSHILVDEFQDINPVERRLLKILASAGAGIFAIGDPDQSIYSFRGSSIEKFPEFEKDYPGAKKVNLPTNYRSSATIVEASNALILNNSLRKTPVLPARPRGEKIEVIGCGDEKTEAEFVVKEIEKLMGGLSSLTVKRHDRGYRFSDFAVLFRTNRQKDALDEAFGNSSIPYTVIGARDELDGFIEHLKAVKIDKDSGISPPEFIREESGRFGIEEGLGFTLKSLSESIDSSKGLSAFIDAFIEALLLFGPSDACEIEADRVPLMTLHAAKGLEWSVVFIAGCEDGFLPMKLKKGGCDVEEERRLFYVGITRAKEKLYLLNAAERRTWGKKEEREKSPFLKELPEGCLKDITFIKERHERRPRQNDFFE